MARRSWSSDQTDSFKVVAYFVFLIFFIVKTLRLVDCRTYQPHLRLNVAFLNLIPHRIGNSGDLVR